MNWNDFFYMGGYAFYVWASWGLTTAFLLWQFVQPKLMNAKIKKMIQRQVNRENKLQTSPK